MTLLYQSPRFLEHGSASHPERPRRLMAITAHLEERGLAERCTRPEFAPASVAEIARLHSPAYIAEVAAYAAAGGGQFEVDTVLSPASYDVALLATGAVLDATRRVIRGDAQNALCLVRPPGHHALAGGAMGFCLFANVSLAAQMALEEFGLERVLIVDWDVHHGNGTQDLFWTSPHVGVFNIHRYPFYPGSGAAEETGSGAGLGTTLNVPVTMGTSRSDYLARFRNELERFAARMRPQLVLISAGFDAHAQDPVGSLGLETEDFATLSEAVLQIAGGYCQGKVVSALEGGYHPQRLAESVGVHLEALLSAAEEGK